MKIIKQTNRTILFDTVNPEKPDLLSLVGNVRGIDRIDDKKLDEINACLLVRSFDEFMDKFEPVVFAYADAGKGEAYSLKKPDHVPEDQIRRISIPNKYSCIKYILLLSKKKRVREKHRDFINVARPLFEIIAGVYIFFNQYDGGQNGVSPTMLICNNNLPALIKGSQMPRLQLYLDTVNNQGDLEDAVWFGIVNHIEYIDFTKARLTRESFRVAKQENKKQNAYSIEDLDLFMNVINEYKIQVFFSFATGRNTSLKALALNGAGAYEKAAGILLGKQYSQYLVCSMPNAGLLAGVEGLEDIYIPGAFVAAGVTASYQCPEFLAGRVGMVSPEYPCVRFDIEGYYRSAHGSRSAYNSIYIELIKKNISGSGFGFIIAYNPLMEHDPLVLSTRCMQIIGQEYENINLTVTATYLCRLIQIFTEKELELDLLLNRRDESSYKGDNTVNYVNSVLYPGDLVSLNVDHTYSSCSIEMKLGGIKKNAEIKLKNEAHFA